MPTKQATAPIFGLRARKAANSAPTSKSPVWTLALSLVIAPPQPPVTGGKKATSQPSVMRVPASVIT